MDEITARGGQTHARQQGQTAVIAYHTRAALVFTTSFEKPQENLEVDGLVSDGEYKTEEIASKLPTWFARRLGV
jgi:hypothetical protein